MLKKILIVAILFVGIPSSAQKIVFGVKGGVNWNSIGELYHYGEPRGGLNLTPKEDVFYQPDNVMGTIFGGFVMFEWERFLVRPEFNWIKKENEYALANATSFWEQSSTDLSILVGIKVIDPLRFYVGPSFTWINEFSLTGPEQPVIYDDSATNIQAGLMVDFKWFGIDLRYEYGLEAFPGQRVDYVRATYGTNVGELIEYNQSTIYLTAHINIFRYWPGAGGGKPKAKWRSKNCF